MWKYNVSKEEKDYSNDYNLFLKEKEEKKEDTGFIVEGEALND